MVKVRGARGGGLLTGGREAELREIKDWYRDKLSSMSPPRWGIDPVRVGMSWVWDGDGFVLPKWSGGWDVLAWTGLWLKNEDGKPWVWTPEQARFILWWHAVDPDTLRWVKDDAVLQRMKGHGKDPLATGVGLCYLVGPSVPERIGDVEGEIRLRPNPAAVVQLFAVSKEQTGNTMSFVRSMLTPEVKQRYGILPLRNTVWALGDSVWMESKSSAPDSVEGNRPSLVIRNETQNWRESNGGHALDGAISGNASKSRKDRPARMLDICNAYREGEDSIAQRTREAWAAAQDSATPQGPLTRDFGLYYDSLEAPDDARLTVEEIPKIINVIRGDSLWLDTDEGGRIMKDILNPKNPASESRRKWYNQIQSAEESWIHARDWDKNLNTDATLSPGDQITMFLDCSKSEDGTALVAARVADGYRYVLGYWQRPPGERGRNWVVSREAVDAVVRRAFDTYSVVGFFADPSHAVEDETFLRFWDPVLDVWHRDFGRRLKVKPTGRRGGHSVMFDMSDYANLKIFVAQVALCEQEILDGVLPHGGDVRLRRHVLNARRFPTRAGVSIGKVNRSSKKKVDLAVAMVGAGLVRRMYLNGIGRRKGGRVR